MATITLPPLPPSLGTGVSSTVAGSPADDSLRGGAGPELLDGGSGIDTLVGGGGSDWYAVDRIEDVVVDADAGDKDLLIVTTSRAARYTLPALVENLWLLPEAAGASVLGNALANVMLGSAGNDTLAGGDGNDTLHGGGGTDRLEGGAGDDLYELPAPGSQIVETAGGGNDTLSVGFVAGARVEVIAHVEVLRLGSSTPFTSERPPVAMRAVGDAQGNHLVAAGNHVVLDGGEGADRLLSQAGFVTLLGGAGNDTLEGVANGGAVRLDGGAGDDELRGRAGATLIGGPGVDLLVAEGGGVVLRIDDRADRIQAASGGQIAEVALSGWWADRAVFSSVRHVDDALPIGYWVDALISQPLLPLGRGGELTYVLPQDTEIEGFTPFGVIESIAVRQAFALWAAGTGLSVREVAEDDPEAAEADIGFGFAELSSIGAAGISVPLRDADGEGVTIVLIDLAGQGGALEADARWNLVLLHEVGHALGLKHPGDYNAGGLPSPPPYLPTAEDNTGWTLLSYVEAGLRGPSDFVTTLPAFDRDTMRALYGLAPGAAQGDTRWAFDATLAAPRWIEDSSGIDHLDASATTGAVTLDLRIGGRSHAGLVAPELVSTPGQWIVGHGSVIEHASGGAGGDHLQGNEGPNLLRGQDGADTLRGALGDDTLDGGAGDDQLADTSGANLLQGGEGDDLFVFTVQEGAGVATFSTVSGGAGQDRLELRINATTLDDSTLDRLRALREQPGAADSAAPWGLRLDGIESVLLRGTNGQPLPNQAPRTRDANQRTSEDTLLEGRLPVASDFEDDTLSYRLIGGNAVGFQLFADGRYRYQPPAEWSGSVEVSYGVDDGRATTLARLQIDVAAVDDTPVVQRTPSDIDAVAGVALMAPLRLYQVRDIDTTALGYKLQREDGQPLPGWLRFDASTLTLSGTPGTADVGVLRLVVVASDSASAIGAPFLLGVHNRPNQHPQAAAALRATEDQTFSGQLPATDADGDGLRYELLAPPGRGRLELAADGTLRYMPEADAFGDDSFLVRASDGRGGSAEFFQRVLVAAVDDAPQNRLQIVGDAKVGQLISIGGGVYDPDGVFATGPGRWQRGDTVLREVRGSGDSTEYLVRPEDVGAVLRYVVSAVDPLGNPAGGSITTTAAVPPLGQLLGSPAAERLSGWSGASRVDAGGGNDTLISAAAFDQLFGGAGDDVLLAGLPGTQIDGGEGFDALVMNQPLWRQIDLKAGTLSEPLTVFAEGAPRQITLAGLEAVSGSFGSERFTGLDGPAYRFGESFRPNGGSDSMDGGTGIDTVELTGLRAQSQLLWEGGTLRVSGSRFGDTVALTSVERLRFDDQLLAFGERAVEVAKVAFVLWSKAIAPSQYLFARGISFYDVGYSYDELITAALGFFAEDSAQRFAERLASNVASGQNAAELLALMVANGGAGAGQAGRAFVTKLAGEHADNLANIELAGFISGGIPCALVADGNLLFAPIGGI